MREYQPAEGNHGKGHCLTQALDVAGFKYLDLPEWVRGDDIPTICEELGLRLHTGQNEDGTGSVILDEGQPVIAIFKTQENRAHCEYTTDLRQIEQQGKQLVAIIELPDKNNEK